MKTKKYLKQKNTVVHGDCREILRGFPNKSVHLVVSDPPYFLDGLDDGWVKGESISKRATGSIGGLPVGMKFNTQNGKRLQDFMEDTATSLLPVLKPGAFALFFSQPRLTHRMAVGLEDAGFEIRDVLAWHFTGRAQPKAFSMNHIIEKMSMPIIEKQKMKKLLEGKKTPQLRPQFETVILAQRPKEGRYIDNWNDYKVGLMDTSTTLDGKFPATLMTVEKPHKEKYNDHLTVKPLKLVEHLIKLFSSEGQIVLDPFLGSGTTAVAAIRTKRKYLGIEINKEYIKIAKKRIEDSKNEWDKTEAISKTR